MPNLIYCYNVFILSYFSDAQLKLFMESMRTQYGRITHPKSGQATDEKISLPGMNGSGKHSSFLAGHIVRIPSRSSCSGVYCSDAEMNE